VISRAAREHEMLEALQAYWQEGTVGRLDTMKIYENSQVVRIYTAFRTPVG
jgi:hypothetical protein